MKLRTIILFNLIFLSSYGQNNSGYMQEITLLANSGIPGLELFIGQLINDSTG
jgi:hypothetical protein